MRTVLALLTVLLCWSALTSGSATADEACGPGVPATTEVSTSLRMTHSGRDLTKVTS